jgi:glycosyltransferase involved in cell wall biosynthesis
MWAEAVSVTAPVTPSPKGRLMSISFGVLGTYPPTQCGIATFSASLVAELKAVGNDVGVVRLVDRLEPVSSVDVVHHLLPGTAHAVAAADALNAFDVVVVQHEFGLYSGADGVDVLAVLEQVDRPIIVVAHTVLTAPSAHQRAVLERVMRRAAVVVTMTRTGHDRLRAGYTVDPAKLVVIPHGAASVPPADPHAVASETLLTWGLLGPGKGIEAAIDAVARLSAIGLRRQYRVVGQTHPKVVERDGEVYRNGLIAQAARLGVSDLVSFHPAYLDPVALRRVIREADVVVLPYESREQVTSGVLIEAVAAGKPVVATAFPHAVELLAGGAGLVVPHDDPVALTRALRRILTEPALVASMGQRSADVAGQVRWSDVARRYQRLAAEIAWAYGPMGVR